ncbi:OprD family porin [Pseudomonas sp. LRF_L74]|uniref:OprD family porin n=1 Tax=Pseudomonas sp. LRF_L74 TaxID=3369422 RepID=UPI003F5FC4B3
MFRFECLFTRIKCVGVIGMLPVFAQAAYLDDSHLTLDMKNFYLDRNYTKSDAAVADEGSWSQGFDLQFISGYTEGPLQFGLDVDVQYAFTLDAHGDDGSLPLDRNGDAVDNYSRAGATAKIRYAKTELKVGDMRPRLPVAWDDDSRQLDTIYQGAVLESRDIDGLVLTGGRFWSVVTRESANHEKLYRYRTSDDLDSDGLNFVGATYSVTPQLDLSYFYGVVEDIYQQHYVGLKHTQELGAGYTLLTDLRYFNNNEEGDALTGAIDNRTYGAMFTLLKGGHKVGLSYQRVLGDTVFPTLNGYIPQPYLVHWNNVPFILPQERSWGVRYQYDFSAIGIQGLIFGTSYTHGSDIDLGVGMDDGTESERDFRLAYTLQNGPLKGLSFDYRNITVKSKYVSDWDENRLITSYSWKFW